VLRYATIGTGDGSRIVIEAAAFGVFSVVAFAGAIRSLERAG